MGVTGGIRADDNGPMEFFVLLIAVTISYLIGWYFGRERSRNDLGLRASQVLRYVRPHRDMGDHWTVITSYEEYIDAVRRRQMPRFMEGPGDLHDEA